MCGFLLTLGGLVVPEYNFADLKAMLCGIEAKHGQRLK